MTVEELKSLFDKHNGEFLKFDRIEERYRCSARPDLHAFVSLDMFLDPDKPGPNPNKGMIAGADHDEIYLSPSLEELANKAITEWQVIDLIRCGVRYDKELDSLCMFV
jgi:hypothetical protein